MNLDHPVFESVFLPLVLALSLTGVLRWMLDARWGRRVAAAAVGIALASALLLTFGAPTWPVRSGMEKLPLLTVLLLAAGIAVDILQPGRVAVAVASAAAAAAIAIWLAWPQLAGGGGTPMLMMLAVATLAGLSSLAGLAAAPSDGANRTTMLVLAALGLAGAGFNAGSLALFQVALSLAAAVGGFALWNWPQPRLPFAASGIAVGGLGGFAVALLLLLLTGIRPWALLPLPLIFASDLVCRRLPAPPRLRRTTIEPLYILVVASIPVILTVLLAQAPPPTDDLYYR